MRPSSPRSKAATPASRSARARPTSPRSHVISNITARRPTSCMARRSLPQQASRLDPARAARRDGPHHPLELSRCRFRPLGRRGAGRRQRLRGQAGGGRFLEHPQGGAPRARSRLSGRRAQCRDGARPDGGSGARLPSRHRFHLLHRQPADRHADPGRRGAKPCRRSRSSSAANPRKSCSPMPISRACVPVVVNAIIQNGGQTCSAGSRVLIERDAYERRGRRGRQTLRRAAGRGRLSATSTSAR